MARAPSAASREHAAIVADREGLRCASTHPAGGLDLSDLLLELAVVDAGCHLELVLLLQGEDAQDRSRGNHCGHPVEHPRFHGRLLGLQGRDVLLCRGAIDRLGQILWPASELPDRRAEGSGWPGREYQCPQCFSSFHNSQLGGTFSKLRGVAGSDPRFAKSLPSLAKLRWRCNAVISEDRAMPRGSNAARAARTSRPSTARCESIFSRVARSRASPATLIPYMMG